MKVLVVLDTLVVPVTQEVKVSLDLMAVRVTKAYRVSKVSRAYRDSLVAEVLLVVVVKTVIV